MDTCILVVDDDPVYREIATAALSAIDDIDILKAANGIEAMACVAQHADRIGLVICDLNMPECDGIEFITTLCNRPDAPPIIFVSGAAHVIVRAAYVLAHKGRLTVIGTLPKPVDFPKLVAMARQVLNQPLSDRLTA